MRYAFLLALMALGLTATVVAQDRARERNSPTLRREVAVDTVRREITVTVDGERLPRSFTMGIQRRARLGIGVNLEAMPSDSLGATVRSVTPGGPAAKAGIKAGDIITRIGNDALVVPRSRRGREESTPGERLIEVAATLAPNDTIKVEYLRDGTRKTVTLVAGDEPILSESNDDVRTFVWRMPDGGEQRAFRMPELRELPGLPDMILEGMPDAPGRIETRRFVPLGGTMLTTGPLADLELAPLNPELGSYFGTTEGILVIKAPAGSPLGLKGGDVVLTVDGRKPSSPTSLIRILRSYDAEETFRLEVLRQKKRETITGSLGRAGREE